MFNLYVSLNGQQMNEVMKVLTIFSAIFIPLTFIAGLYGMNFQNMPELAKPWGYPAVLGLMTAVAGAMLVYFWRKKWF
jgi:magnesium transporter